MMMRSTITAVLERNTVIRDGFTTDPYELPWASEARFFVQTLTFSGDHLALAFRTQISPDGLHWCDLDDQIHEVTGPGLVSWGVAGFGQWLRLTVSGPSGDPRAKVQIYLVGKA